MRILRCMFGNIRFIVCTAASAAALCGTPTARAQRPLEMAPVASDVSLDERPHASLRPRFGIEIETTWLTGYTRAGCVDAYLLRALNRAHEPPARISTASRPWFVEAFGTAESTAFVSLVNAGWTSTCDISVWWQSPDGLRYGEELVSPILGYENRHEAALMAEAAQQAGAAASPMSGVHVHVGAEALGLDTLLHTVRFMARFEGSLYEVFKITPQRGGRYARPISSAFVQDVAQTRPQSCDDLILLFAQHHALHRSGLDLTSISRLGTLEFRYFNGSVDPEVISLYVDFAHAVVQAARNAGAFTQQDSDSMTPTPLAEFYAVMNETEPQLGDRLEAFAARSQESLGEGFVHIPPPEPPEL